MQAQLDFPPVRRLVILGCSATKRDTPGFLPAVERYNGPLWQTLRTVDPTGALASCAFVSARYGFGGGDRPIQDYNVRMTPEIARHLIAGGLGTRWPRPATRKESETCGMHAGCEIAGLSRYGRQPFDDVALAGGELYLVVMRALVALFQQDGHITPTARITEINGPIGCMRQQLRHWLESSAPILPR